MNTHPSRPAARRSRFPLVLISSSCLAAACPGPDTDTTSTDTDPPSRFESVQEGLPGAILSVWAAGPDDVWFAGADPNGDGSGARHYDGNSWQIVDLGVDSDLWWVFGQGDARWFVGEQGVILRHDVGSGTTTALDSGVDAMLFGIWGAPDGPLYTVGGTPGTGPAVLLQIDGDSVSPVSGLPAGVPSAESFFKVWGSGAQDVWVIGDLGSVLHFDGASWSRQVLPGSPRLVTVNGGGPDDIVVVGGATRGAIFEREGQAWTDASPASASPLNGVSVHADGYAVAAGFNAQVYERVDGSWSDVPLTSAAHWHGVWADADGSWLVGGNLTSLTDGAITWLARP